MKIQREFVQLLLGALCVFLVGSVGHAQDYEGRLVEGHWQESWNDTLAQSIDNSPLLNHTDSETESVCPGYKNDPDKRKLFWQQLFISLSWKESMHGPGNYVDFNDGINIGLFQIDPRLEKAYGCTNYDLYDALSNIRCAVKMATKLVKKFGTFLQGEKGGMAAYWQPLRSSDELNTENRDYILASVTKACKTSTIAYISTTHSLAFNAADVIDLQSINVNTIDDLGLDPSELSKFPDDSDSTSFDREYQIQSI